MFISFIEKKPRLAHRQEIKSFRLSGSQCVKNLKGGKAELTLQPFRIPTCKPNIVLKGFSVFNVRKKTPGVTNTQKKRVSKKSFLNSALFIGRNFIRLWGEKN